MIKLKKIIKEGVTQRNYDAEIIALEKEWERLDSMGNQEGKQRRISDALVKLRGLKAKWEKMYQAVK